MGSQHLSCAGCGSSYPLRLGIPRFIADESYAANFGYQWKLHSRTQLDRHSGLNITRDRFYRQTGWKPEELRGKRVLEAGCGAGEEHDLSEHVDMLVLTDAIPQLIRHVQVLYQSMIDAGTHG